MTGAELAAIRSPLTGPPDRNNAGPTPRFVGDLWFCTAAGGAFTANTLYEWLTAWQPLGQAGAGLDSFIGGNVALAQNSYTDITSLSLAAGTWLVLGQAWIIDTAVSPGVTQAQLRIFDATANVSQSSAEGVTPALQNQGAGLTCKRRLVLTQTSTIKLQGTGGSATLQANAALSNNAAGNTATGLTAVPGR